MANCNMHDKVTMGIQERVSRPSSAVNAPVIVAVACFAGDVAAPSELASALPADCGAAFISLFTSLAQEFGTDAIGVILSGGGSDRALGIQAIRHAGGITFAQHPGSARFPNTPISAIDTGCVDFVLRPNEIARELVRISRSRHKATAARTAVKKIQITQPEPFLTLSAPATASSLADAGPHCVAP